MINVEVKYLGKPVRLNKARTETIKYIKNYIIDEYVKAEDYYDTSQAVIRKEVTQIFKRHKGLYDIRFYINGANK